MTVPATAPTGALTPSDVDGAAWARLRSLAVEAMGRAYAPYSRFRVGAAGLVDDGRLVSGCNVENAGYGVTLCAECGLVSELVRTGGGRLIAFACVDGRGEPCAPCGRCRQVLGEHAHPRMLLAMPDGLMTIDEVLPGRFTRADLEAPGADAGAGGRAEPADGSGGTAGAEPAGAGAGAVEPFDAVDVIAAKRERRRLSDAQIDWVVDAYTRGAVAEEQMSALAMAICMGGMDRAEIARWTDAMIRSGERMDFSGLGRPTADKHSTGGVGDKITLPLAPLVATFGVGVPQLSGRGLGHTGGTLDKLESIPGWRADLTGGQIMSMLGPHGPGAVICAAGPGLAPADRRLYALRDTTGTVPCVPLIASSIMSKKIAEGTGALVLDVKVGSGAFMKDPDSARELARTMVALGAGAGVSTRALLTDMSAPLGLTAGNALEVREAVEVLAGGGPADVVGLTLALAAEMLDAAGRPVDPDELRAALADGRAMDVWREMIRRQGGDPDAPLPVAPETDTLTAPADGVLVTFDALAVGVAAWRLGAGRARRGDPVQAGAGVEMHAKPGDAVRAGQPLLTLHTADPGRFERARRALAGAVVVAGPDSPDAARARRRAAAGVVLERLVPEGAGA